MISSDLHGAEEPIRWTLGWQMQDRVYDEPMHREEKNALIRTFWHRFGLWGSAPGRWTWTMMDRTPPLMLDDFQGTWQLLGWFGTCGMMLEAQEGQRSTHLVVIMP
jgi:hypothetical protein